MPTKELLSFRMNGCIDRIRKAKSSRSIIVTHPLIWKNIKGFLMSAPQNDVTLKDVETLEEQGKVLQLTSVRQMSVIHVINHY